MRLRTLFLAAALTTLLGGPSAVAQSVTTYSDDFQSYGEHANPSGWIDSSVGVAKPEAAGLYKTWGDPTQGNKATNVVYGTRQSSGQADPNGRMGTFSTYTAKSFSGTGRFEYRGRFIRTTSDARIGLTFFSSYPERDQYYLAGLMPAANGSLTIRLLSFGAGTLSGTLDSGFSPDPNKWYWFDIQADALESETRIRARFWLDGSTEPTTWSIDARDGAASRLTAGRIGVWSAVGGDAYIDDVSAKSPVDHTAPSIAFFESNQPLTADHVFNRDAAPEVRVTDDSSGVASVTVKLDGEPYVSQTPITSERYHQLDVDALDHAGNAAHASVRFAIDKTAPAISIADVATAIRDGAIFNHDVKPVVTVTDLTPVTTSVRLDGAPFTAGTVVTSEGRHTITAAATDAAGFTSNVSVSFSIDKRGPELTVIAPKHGDVLTDATVIVTGGSDDAVSLSVNGIPAATLDTSTHTFTSAPIALAEGTNTITVTAVDAAGNPGSLTITVSLDTRAPQLAVTSPVVDACLDVEAVDLHGTVSDAHPGSVTVSYRGASFAATVDATGAWTAHVPNVPEGPAVFVVTATDTAGHTASATRRVSIDHTAPDIDINENGAAFTLALVNRPVTLTVDVTDADPRPAVTLMLDGASFTSGSTISAEGQHTLTATATDCAGLKTERHVVFAMDTKAPLLSGLVPADGAMTGTTPVTIHGTTSEASTISAGGINVSTTGAGAFDIAGVSLKEGLNRFTIHAVDEAGNAAEIPYSVTLRTAVPVVEILENGIPIGANALFNRAVTPVIRSSAPDAALTATLDGQTFTTGTRVSAEGTHTITATATDPVGHSGSASASFTIDTTAPVVRITAPANAAKVTGDTVTVTGSAGDAVTASVNGIPATLAADGGFTTTVTLEPGENAVVVSARDRAGNGSSAQITVTRDDFAAGLILTSPLAPSTNRKTVVVSGRILTPANAKTLTISGTNGTSTTGPLTPSFDATGAFLVPDFALFEGTNTITATVAATNGRTSTATAVIRCDLTPPTLRILANGQTLDDGARFASSVTLGLETIDAADTKELRVDGAVVAAPYTLSANGTHTAVATAKDAAGNEARLVRSFAVGTQSGGGCSLSQFDPADGATVTSPSVTITGQTGATGVKINGVPAQVASGSFRGTAELTQEGANTVTLRCTDAAGTLTGTAATLTLYRVTSSPSITITSPAEMTNLGTATVDVTGTIGTGVVSVDVNGAAATITGATFTAKATLAAGLNVLVARAKNAAGKIATASRRVVYLQNAPALSIRWPSDALSTAAAAIDVSGTYTNLDPSTIRAGGAVAETHVDSDTSGSFVIRGVPLANGTQTVTVTGTDALGRSTTASVSVTRDASGPWVAITAPANNSYSSAATVTVSGAYSAAAGAHVDVAGTAATLSGSSFSGSATLGENGATPIVARVTAPDGATSIATAYVTRLPGAPVVKEMFPAADATAVDAGVIVLVSFTAPMDRASLADGFVLLDSAGQTISGQRRLDRDVLSFAPATTLTPGQRYTALVRTSARDLAGNAVAQEVRSSFTIGTTAPATAPSVDPIATPVCASTVRISGTAPASSRIEISIGGIPQYATADASGRFSALVSVPSQSGYRVARVRVLCSDGSSSPAADAPFQIDCGGPVVTGAVYDRAANAITVTFSKPIDIATAAPAVSLKLGSGSEVTFTVATSSSNALVITPGAPDPRSETLVLTIATSLKDTTGQPLPAPFSTSFMLAGGGSDPAASGGQGYVSGQVLDATTGRPLAAATVALSPAANVRVTDANGRYTFVLAEGAYTLHASAAGHTDVWRQVVVPAGAGIIPLDVRLTVRGAKASSSGSTLTREHGADDAVTRKVTLTVPAASAPNGTSVTLTSVGAQSLSGLLPLGWSPIAAAEVRVEWPASPLANAIAQLTFDLPAEAAASGRSFAAVQYDQARDEWRVLQPVVAISSNTATVNVTLSAAISSYALVYADSGAGLAIPPQPTAGAVLAGVHDPCASNCAPLAAKSFPVDPSIIPPSGVTTATLIMEGAGTYPSGTAVQALVAEELRLTDGSVESSMPFSADLVLYRSLTENTASAAFHLQPSTRAGSVPLQIGFEHIQVFPYPGRLDRGTLVGPAGGPIPGDDRVQVDIPSGAAPEAIHATAQSMTTDALAQFRVAGFNVVAGFTLAMTATGNAESGSLLKPATATFTVDASAAASQLIVAEVLGETPYGRIVRLVAQTSAPVSVESTSKARVTTSAIDRQALPLDGIVRPGQYLLLAAQQPIAFAFGSVRFGAQGAYAIDAHVESSSLGVGDLSRVGGLFAVPVVAAPAAPFALTPSHPTTGSGAPYTATTAPAMNGVVPIGDLVLTAQPPALQHVNVVTSAGASDLLATPARDVVLTTSIAAVFSQAIDTASVASTSITLADAGGQAVAGSLRAEGATLTWTSAAPLLPNASYVVTIAGSLRGTFGAPLGSSRSFGFATVTVLSNAQIHPEKIHITIPDANGVATVYGDPGALPTIPPEVKAWRAVALRRGRAFVTQYQATSANDGSFSFRLGDCGGATRCTDAVSLSDRIDLEILNAADNIAAVLPLGPFSSADGQAFVALSDADTSFTTRDGVSIRVPAGAFDAPATIRAARLDTDAAFAAVPNIHNELNFYRGLQLSFDCGEGIDPAVCVAKKRLDVSIPLPAGADTTRKFLLGWLGESVRGPRVMVVDTLRVDGGSFTSAAQGASPTLKAAHISPIGTTEVLTGSDIKKFLMGVTRSGIYNVMDIRTPEGTNLGWAVMDGMQRGLDVFWSIFSSLFASHLYLEESYGRTVIPVLTNRPFEMVGYDAGTGLQAFSKVYNPLPNGDPGAAFVIDTPAANPSGPYPVFALPNRVETVGLQAEDVDITSVRNFVIRLSGGYAAVSDGTPKLPDSVEVSLLNVTNGEYAPSRNALSVKANVGDRLLLVVGERNVDPTTSLSVVFSRPIHTGSSADAEAISTYLHSVISLERAAKPVANARPVYGDIGSMARYSVDSDGRRVKIDLPSELERGAFYRISLTTGLAAAAGGAPGLGLGKVASGPANAPLTDALRLVFQVRDVPDPLTSFDLRQTESSSVGSIRDLALNGNVLLMSAGTGGVLAYDIADPASLSSASLPIGRVVPEDEEYWAIASDQHGRVYATGLNSTFGFVHSFRLEDLVGTAGAPAVVSAPRSQALICWIPGSTSGSGLGAETVLSDRPEGLPRRLQLAVQDTDHRYESLAAFVEGMAPRGGSVTASDAGNGFTKLRVTLPRESGSRYRMQRITIENLTRDMRWSADAVDTTSATIDNVIARESDQLRLVYNERTYGVITIFGFGAGIFDLNAVESNDLPNPPAGYSALAERVRLTRGVLNPDCPGQFPNASAIADLSFAPEIAVIPQSTSGNLKIYGPDVRQGVLDENIALATTTTISAPASCDDRAPMGLVMTPASDARFAELESKFKFATGGRAPYRRFGGAQTYHWTLEAADNKAIAPASSPSSPAVGQRGSIAGTRVERDYLLIPAYEYGLVIVDTTATTRGSSPIADTTSWLAPGNVADVIWIPAGAVTVRIMPRTHYATVVDGEGRVLLVDIGRIDERWTASGALYPAASLFPTAAAALDASGTYGIGAADPRILWTSEPGVAGGALAPVIDSDTGILFAGQLQGRKTTVLAIGDPRIKLRADTGSGSLAEIGGIVPLGVDPPEGILNASDRDASLAAFRLELTLPGGIVERLGGSQLRLAVESERVAGAITEQTPAPLPRAHLRATSIDGTADTRPASGFVMQRDIPASMAAVLRRQKGFNKFISPWVVAVADPRASSTYVWPRDADKNAAGCAHCDRPQRLAGLTEADGVFELWSAGRSITTRPEVCGGAVQGCAGLDTIFSGTKYAYLGQQDRLTARFATVMADTVRTPEVRTAAQATPVASGALQEAVYLHSGELATSNVDLAAGGRAGWNVAFDRTYRSRTLLPDVLGRGWSSSMFRRIRALPNGTVELRDATGEIWLFRRPAAAGQPYTAPAGLFVNLIRTDTGWQLVDQKRRVTTFDDLGRLVSESDEFGGAGVASGGNTIRYLYDLSGRLAQIIDPVSRASRLEYWDAAQPGWKAGRLKTITDWRGRKVDFDYDADGRLLSAALPDVANVDNIARPTLKYGYDPIVGSFNEELEIGGLLKTITDPSGGSTPRVTFTYGTGADRGKVTGQSWATGETASFAYATNAATVTDALKQVRRYTLTTQPANYFDDRAHIATMTEAAVVTSKLPIGNLPTTVSPTSFQTEPQDRTYTFTYENGALKSATLDGVSETNVAYSTAAGAPGRIPQSVEIKPLATPGALMPASASKLLRRTFHYQDNDPLFLASVGAALGPDAETAVSTPEPHRGLRVPSAANDSVTSKQTFDEHGLLTALDSTGGTDGASSGAAGKIEYKPETASDWERGRPSRIDRGGAVTQFLYPDKDTITTIDPRGITTTTKLDAWGRTVKVNTTSTDLKVEETYAYDATGRLRTTTRQQGSRVVKTTLTYDAIGRTTSVETDNIDIEGSSVSRKTTTAYDLGKHTVSTSISPVGPTTTHTIDNLGRTVTTQIDTGQTPIVYSYAYDKAGNLAFESDNFVATAYAYDAHGRQIATLYQDGTQDFTDFDAWNHARETTSRDAAMQTIAHATAEVTPAGRLKSTKSDVELGGLSRLGDFKWDGAGRMTRTGVQSSATTASIGDKRASWQTFDTAGRLKQHEFGSGDTSSITEQFSTAKVAAFVNSNSDLPSSATTKERTGVEYASTFDYDANGNTTKAATGSLKWEQHFDEAGNVTKAAEPNRPPTAFNYDGRGATTDMTEPGDAKTQFTWTSVGALKNYVDPKTETTSTDSDLAGRPLKRHYPDGTTEQFVWSGPRLVSFTDRQGRIQSFGYNDRNQLVSIREGAGEEIDHIDYDQAGRIVAWTNRDSKIESLDFDLEGHPKRTRQTRYKDGSGLAGKVVLDSFEQTHTWNAHGERTSWQMPRYAGFKIDGWTDIVFEDYDAAGNVSAIQRTYFGGAVTPSPLMSATYRNTGRPDRRTLTTSCVGGASCTAADIIRDYAYDAATGQLNEMRVSVAGNTIAGSHVAFDGLQISDITLLGISGDERHTRFTYDDRSRVSGFVYGTSDTSATPAGGAPGTTTVTQSSAGFVTAMNRTPAIDSATRTKLAAKGVDVSSIDPGATSATEAPGHKIDQFTTPTGTRAFVYTGALRADDGRFTYTWDEKSRLTSVTEKPVSTAMPIRRIRYYFDGNDRVIGRRAEYATPSSLTASPDTFSWRLEDRPGVLANEGLPAEATFVWDPIADTLVEIWKAGATVTTDANGGLLKQIIHGGAAYDDPVEVTFPSPALSAKLARIYPVFDEAGSGALQAVLNANGELVARNLPGDAFGAANADLAGAIVDRIAVKATKDTSGALQSVEVTLRSTEALKASTLASGVRLATLDASGKVVTTSTVTPALADSYTARFTLPASAWTSLTTAPAAASLSIAATSSLRAETWGDLPILPPPDWVKATQPLFTSSDKPVELRESLASLSSWIAGVTTSDTRTLYEVEALALAGTDGGSDSPLDQVVASRFQALPFSDPATGLVYARKRWYDPETAVFLSPDSLGYGDSSNLYAFARGDSANGRDPSGELCERANAASWWEWTKRCTQDVAWVAEAFNESISPAHVVANTKRAVGGLRSTAKLVAGVGQLAWDVATMSVNDAAADRMVARGHAVRRFAAHPITTTINAHQAMANDVLWHEERGEYVSAGASAAQQAQTDFLAVYSAYSLTGALSRAVPGVTLEATPYGAGQLAEAYGTMQGSEAMLPAAVPEAAAALVPYSTGAAIHYTYTRWVSVIERTGLRPGTYATPIEDLSPIQAQLELALSPERGLPEVRIRIDLEALRADGYEIPAITRVSNVVTGASGGVYRMAGGGYEMQFPYAIPAKYVKVMP